MGAQRKASRTRKSLLSRVGKPGFFHILTTLRSKTPSLASCSKLTNFVVNKPRDFSCLLGVPGEPKSAMIAELHAAERQCVDVIG